MIVNYQPNPLNKLGLRQLDFCPPHFFPVVFDLKGTSKKISDWVWEHLSGRFFYGEIYLANEENNYKPTLQKVVAFEIHSEASYFSLMLNDINKF
jgi:hypothetical protein